MDLNEKQMMVAWMVMQNLKLGTDKELAETVRKIIFPRGIGHPSADFETINALVNLILDKYPMKEPVQPGAEDIVVKLHRQFERDILIETIVSHKGEVKIFLVPANARERHLDGCNHATVEWSRETKRWVLGEFPVLSKMSLIGLYTDKILASGNIREAILYLVLNMEPSAKREYKGLVNALEAGVAFAQRPGVVLNLEKFNVSFQKRLEVSLSDMKSLPEAQRETAVLLVTRVATHFDEMWKQTLELFTESV